MATVLLNFAAKSLFILLFHDMAKYTNPVITEERFPSMGFRRWLLEGDEFTQSLPKFNSDEDLLQVKNIWIYVSEFGDCRIDSIKGIELFPNLEQLTLFDDIGEYDDYLDGRCKDYVIPAFDTIDLRQNKRLEKIEINAFTQHIYADGLPFLTSIVVECPFLKELTYDSRQLEYLRIHRYDGITSIDGSKYPKLTTLTFECCDNLTSIVFHQNSDLQVLNCRYDDELQQLDLSGCPYLRCLGMEGSNQLTKVFIHTEVRDLTLSTDLKQWQGLGIIRLPAEFMSSFDIIEEPNDYMLLHRSRQEPSQKEK